MRKLEIKRGFIIRNLLLLITLFLILIKFSFSWLPRRNEPYISSDNITINIDGGLVFILDSGIASSKISINDYYNLTNFYLKPVSSLYGYRDSFYRLTYVNNELGESISLRKTNNEISYFQNAVNNGYIDFSLFLYNQTLNENIRFVYFSSDTIVTDYDINNGTNAYKAIRVAITLDPLHEETSTLLFRPTRIFPHNALIGEGNYYIPGTTNKNQTIITSNADIKFFDNYMVNDSFINGSGNLDTSKALLSLEPNEKRKINIRIWLEGEDQSHCNDLTIGEAVRIKIGFVGYTSE